MIAFYVIPAIITAKVGEELSTSSLNSILIGALLGGIGGVIGGATWFLIAKKDLIIKTVSLVVLTGMCITAFVVSIRWNQPVINTCEVCGFLAIPEGQDDCQYCGSRTWEVEDSLFGHESKTDWLREEQLFWFSIDSIGQTIDLYEPDPSNIYMKDPNWKPVITHQDLLNDFN